MSFLTRKPENAQTPSPAAAAPERQAGANAEIQSGKPAGSVSSGRVSETVSLAALYQAIADSQSQIAQYLLAREADVQERMRSGNCGTLHAEKVVKVPSEGSATEAFPSLSGNPALAGELHQMAQHFPVILDRLNMLGQFMDQQMLPALMQRFEHLELLLKGTPAVFSGISPEMATGNASAMAGNGEMAAAGNASDPGTEMMQGAASAVQAGTQNASFADDSITAPESVTEDPAASRSAMPAPSAPMRNSRSGGTMEQLDKAVFGEMALEPSIQNVRQYVLQGILAHDAVCSYLGGILMMFQSSTPEKMVLLLKDLGEALYRLVNSLPESDLEQFEDSVARWAQWLCESAGLQNRIELVHPGQRFDSARHNSALRGVTVTQVMGWVILRGNGSVYSKALVDVQ